ncbi:MAG: FAD-binding oxidoreductase [Parachlamydiaceae bacterium]|nr:FAD-binding oxidoreductase [Parachlamydiaceae bacterium]
MAVKKLKQIHDQEILQLQNQLQFFWEQRFLQQNSASSSPISLRYDSNGSYTTRTKSYKKGCFELNCSSLNRVIEVDLERRVAIAEPRVSMEALIQATLPYGLTPAVIPELKGITVGGAIVGMAAESASHRWGTFNDTCSALEFLTANGNLMRVTPTENPDLFYGFAGSYGSLGALVLAEIKLIPANECVHLRYTIFPNPSQCVAALLLRSRAENAPDFLDGIILNKKLAVMIEGNLASKSSVSTNIPHFSTRPLNSQFYYQHVQQIAEGNSKGFFEEVMSHRDYYFRYDLGAFWIGAYIFHLPLLRGLIVEGILNWSSPKYDGFTESEVRRFHNIPDQNGIYRALFRPITNCKNLCKMLHKSEKWVKSRFMIQDYCIPGNKAYSFLEQILDDPGIYPMWLLPIKGTKSPQIFAPHLLPDSDKEEKKASEKEENSHFINFGLYGIPNYSGPVEQITRKLEQTIRLLGGKKVLYSHSYYSREEFWEIYSHASYKALREKTGAEGFWHDIVDKVLSI